MAVSDFQLAVRGDFQAVIDHRQTAILKGLRQGTTASVDEAKLQARRDLARAGFPRRLQTTLRGDVYPRRGLSHEPAGLVYSKAPHIVAGHADGATLRARNATYLPVPISGGPADGLRRRNGESLIDAFQRRYGRDSLRFARTGGGKLLLVARMRANVAGTRFTAVRTSRRKDGSDRTRLDRIASVPAFTMVRRAKLRKTLNTRAILAKAGRRHPARLAFAMSRALERSLDETELPL